MASANSHRRAIDVDRDGDPRPACPFTTRCLRQRFGLHHLRLGGHPQQRHTRIGCPTRLASRQ